MQARSAAASAIGSAFSMSPASPARRRRRGSRPPPSAWHRLGQRLVPASPRCAARYPDALRAAACPLERWTCARATSRACARRSTSSASTSTRACSCTRTPKDRLGLGARALFGLGGARRARRPTSAGRCGPTRSTTWWCAMTRDYDRPVIEITENGCSYADAPGADGAIRDQRRIDFYRGYLARARARDRGRRRRARLPRVDAARQLRVGRGLRPALRPRLGRLRDLRSHAQAERANGTAASPPRTASTRRPRAPRV